MRGTSPPIWRRSIELVLEGDQAPALRCNVRPRCSPGLEHLALRTVLLPDRDQDESAGAPTILPTPFAGEGIPDMAAVVYFLCTLTCLACFAMVLRDWFASRSRVLLWSTFCFAGLSVNNFLLVIDKLVFTHADLHQRFWRPRQHRDHTAVRVILLFLSAPSYKARGWQAYRDSRSFFRTPDALRKPNVPFKISGLH